MSRNWQIFCYGIAAVAFFLAFIGVEVNSSPRRGPLRWWTPQLIALGLFFFVLVPLVSTINTH